MMRDVATSDAPGCPSPSGSLIMGSERVARQAVPRLRLCLPGPILKAPDVRKQKASRLLTPNRSFLRSSRYLSLFLTPPPTPNLPPATCHLIHFNGDTSMPNTRSNPFLALTFLSPQLPFLSDDMPLPTLHPPLDPLRTW